MTILDYRVTYEQCWNSYFCSTWCRDWTTFSRICTRHLADRSQWRICAWHACAFSSLETWDSGRNDIVWLHPQSTRSEEQRELQLYWNVPLSSRLVGCRETSCFWLQCQLHWSGKNGCFYKCSGFSVRLEQQYASLLGMPGRVSDGFLYYLFSWAHWLQKDGWEYHLRYKSDTIRHILNEVPVDWRHFLRYRGERILSYYIFHTHQQCIGGTGGTHIRLTKLRVQPLCRNDPRLWTQSIGPISKFRIAVPSLFEYVRTDDSRHNWVWGLSCQIFSSFFISHRLSPHRWHTFGWFIRHFPMPFPLAIARWLGNCDTRYTAGSWRSPTSAFWFQ